MITNEKKINYPPRLDLARLPTPLEPLRRLSEELDVELHVKRDDLTGLALSGNKVRKLEFVLADALKEGADTVITCGGAQSNHARATAVAAARLGIGCHLILRTVDPANPPALEGNTLLDRMTGAEILWVSPGEYARRDEIFEREATRLKKAGRRPYLIPEGASNALGAWGYILAAEELARDLSGLPGGLNRTTTIIHATGSGGTGAGLIMGAKMLGLNVRIASINVCDDRAHFVRVIGEICGDAMARYELNMPFSSDRDVEIVDGYVGRGYALSQPQELSLIRHVARKEGIFLDPVYTGKAFFGMTQELKRHAGCFGERVVFLHTGGIFGLFPKASEISPLL
jgi:D-cysteine desulfhydrase